MRVPLEKLVSWKMPFGKHAGTVLADLPGNHLAWFAREGFPEGELGQLLELMHTIDHNDLRGLLEPVRRGLIDKTVTDNPDLPVA